VNSKTYTEPDAMSQHAALSSDPAWPHFGRDALDRQHAVFSIVAHLKTLGLAGWTAHVLSWLARFDGIEPHIPREHEPLASVRQILYGFVLSGRHISDTGGGRLKEDVTSALVNAEFVKYVAYWLPGPDTAAASDELAPAASGLHLWTPLHQSWLSYTQHLASLARDTCEGMMILRVVPGATVDQAAHRSRLWGAEA
jgi:hypothetical protein